MSNNCSCGCVMDFNVGFPLESLFGEQDLQENSFEFLDLIYPKNISEHEILKPTPLLIESKQTESTKSEENNQDSEDLSLTEISEEPTDTKQRQRSSLVNLKTITQIVAKCFIEKKSSLISRSVLFKMVEQHFLPTQKRVLNRRMYDVLNVLVGIRVLAEVGSGRTKRFKWLPIPVDIVSKEK